MKKLTNTILITLMYVSCFAQFVDVKEGTKTMKEGSYNAYSIVLEDINYNHAEEGWKDFMKEYKAKTKKDKKAKLQFSDNVQLPSIGSNPVDIYAMILEDERDAHTTVTVWFDTGNGYVNSIDMEPQSEVAERMMTEYALKVLKKSADNNYKDEEKALKKIESELKNLQDKKKDLLKDISKAKENILKWEKELEQNEANQINKKKAVENQKETVNKAEAKARKFI